MWCRQAYLFFAFFLHDFNVLLCVYVFVSERYECCFLLLWLSTAVVGETKESQEMRRGKKKEPFLSPTLGYAMLCWRPLHTYSCCTLWRGKRDARSLESRHPENNRTLASIFHSTPCFEWTRISTIHSICYVFSRGIDIPTSTTTTKTAASFPGRKKARAHFFPFPFLSSDPMNSL